MAVRPQRGSIFHLIMIKPSHYGDDGYPIQWLRSAIPSNTLACLNGIAEDCAARNVLGEGVELRVEAYDETNRLVRPARIMRQIERDGGKALIAMIGVQSNQYPRALDLARPFREKGFPVCIGGFHVSGCISMLDDLHVTLQEAQALGISLFAGEAEDGRLDEVLRDAYRGELKPLYNHMKDLPDLANQPIPMLPLDHIRRYAGSTSSVDLGRGCPFQCSFCTIINVQGRKSRFRTVDDLELIIRQNAEQGIHRFLITDDNFARNRNWEGFFDRMIWLRESEGLRISLTIQVDTLCHKIDRFIDKAKRAGVNRAFIGLENINPDSLIGAKKRQNKITEYRKMLLEWKRVGIMTFAGYILGFPNDTPDSIRHDLEIIKKELPVDALEFFVLTPLPGSEDHKVLFEKNVWMDPDMNKYELEHVVTGHAKMTKDEWQDAYRTAWDIFYTDEHLETIMRRAAATGINIRSLMPVLMWFSSAVLIENLHPLQWGIFRVKYRKDRRSTFPLEPRLSFYARYARETAEKAVKLVRRWRHLKRIVAKIEADPRAALYMDGSLTPVADEDAEHMDLYTQNEAARVAVERERRVAGVRPNGHNGNGHDDARHQAPGHTHDHHETDVRRPEIVSPPA